MTVPPSNPLTYLNALRDTIPWVMYDFAPTSANNAFTIPTLWIDSSADIYYILVAKPNGVAVWVPSTSGTSPPIESVAVQATTSPGVSPVVPTAAGLVTLNGAAVAAQTIPVQSRSTALNSLQVEVQRASSSASTNATQQGLSSFNSSHFSVDGSGFVSLSGGGKAIDGLIPDSGTSPVVPDGSGDITIAGGSNISTVGGTNTLTVNLDDTITLTQVNATTFDTNVAAAGATLSGTTLAADGTDANISMSLTPKGTGGIVIPTDLTIGNTVQDVNFTVNGASIKSALTVSTQGASDLGGLLSDRHTDTAAFGAHELLLRSRGTQGTPTIVQADDTLSIISSCGYDGTDWAQAAQIIAQVDGTPGANDMPGRLVFLVSPDGSQTPAEALRISQDKSISAAGVAGISVANPNMVTINTSTGQLGSATFETGTFTPTISFGGGTTGITYLAQSGTYWAIGGVYYFVMSITLTSKGTDTGNNLVTLGALPNSSNATANYVYTCTSLNITYDTSHTMIYATLLNSTNTMNIQTTASNLAANTTLTDANFANDSSFFVTGFYFV